MYGGMVYVMAGYLMGMMGFTTKMMIDPFSSATTTPPPTLTAFPTFPVTPMPFRASTNGQGGTQQDGMESNSPPVAAVQPTYTPYPTPTPYPTQIPIVGDLFAVGYSYYWPPYGPPNCHADNWDEKGNYCKDLTASGERWTEHIGRGVAVPYEWKVAIPLGSYIRVHDNIEMQGDYKVIDFCGGCITPEGHIYIDFLDNRQRLAWTVPLMIEVIYRPGTQ